MYSLQSVESFPEARRQALVCLDHVGEQGVTTCGGAVERIQESCAGGLLLEGDIRVPCNSIGALLQEGITGAVVSTAEDKVNLWEPLGGPRGLVDVVSAKVSGIVDNLLDRAGCEVLVAEGCLDLLDLCL